MIFLLCNLLLWKCYSDDVEFTEETHVDTKTGTKILTNEQS